MSERTKSLRRPAARNRTAKTLTQAALVEAAAKIVDKDGIEGLSMRRLAERCGVSAMTPYAHVANKEELLRLLADRYLGAIDLSGTSDQAWDAYLREVFHAVRRLLLQHPALASIVARQHVNGQSGYRGAELVLGALRRAGLDPEAAVTAFGALTAYTIGFVQQELPAPDRDAQLGARMLAVSRLGADEFPNITAAADAFIHRDKEPHFDMGLQLLINGIRAAGR